MLVALMPRSTQSLSLAVSYCYDCGANLRRDNFRTATSPGTGKTVVCEKC